MSYVKKLVLVPKKWILRNWFSYSLFQSKGPFYDVLTGRRDSRRSVIFDVIGNLPSPTSNFANLTILFASRGLTVKDLVALSGIIRVHIWDAICYPDSDDCFSFPRQGGHTIGTSHCSSFANRLYDPSGKDIVDPTLESEYVPKLKSKCKPNDTTTLVEMDPGSHKTFDSKLFQVGSQEKVSTYQRPRTPHQCTGQRVGHPLCQQPVRVLQGIWGVHGENGEHWSSYGHQGWDQEEMRRCELDASSL